MSQTQQDAFRREINISLAVGALMEFDLPVTSEDGGHSVVAALGTEPVSTLLRRLQAVGGRANVFVRDESGAIRFLAVTDVQDTAASPV